MLWQKRLNSSLHWRVQSLVSIGGGLPAAGAIFPSGQSSWFAATTPHPPEQEDQGHTAEEVDGGPAIHAQQPTLLLLITLADASVLNAKLALSLLLLLLLLLSGFQWKMPHLVDHGAKCLEMLAFVQLKHDIPNAQLTHWTSWPFMRKALWKWFRDSST
jgi:hypothetical protein